MSALHTAARNTRPGLSALAPRESLVCSETIHVLQADCAIRVLQKSCYLILHVSKAVLKASLISLQLHRSVCERCLTQLHVIPSPFLKNSDLLPIFCSFSCSLSRWWSWGLLESYFVCHHFFGCHHWALQTQLCGCGVVLNNCNSKFRCSTSFIVGS